MLIANPIYDVVFKRLMENQRAARFFIGTLLNEPILSVVVKPQEFTYVTPDSLLSVFRLDFIATVVTPSGARKILIEVQKARNHVDLMRFRNYLAEQYKKEDLLEKDSIVLPIVTIYILGFQLPEIKTPCLKVNRVYLNMVDNQLIANRDDFVEKLTHDTFILQVTRVHRPILTPLDELLSIFEQTTDMHTISITKRYNHTPQSEDAQVMVDLLRQIAMDPAEQKQADDEREAWRTFDAMSGGLLTQARKTYKQIREMETTLQEKTSELQEKTSELQEKTSELQEKTSELQEKTSELQEKTSELQEKTSELQEKTSELQQAELVLQQKNKLIEELQQRLNEK